MTKDAVATMGTLLPEDVGGRDAVHVAVVSVMAGEPLTPGQHVGFKKAAAENAFVGKSGELVGIVDPFLTEKVYVGQRFWLYLYPRTITSLRHNWTHPKFQDTAFPDAAYARPTERVDSETWLRDFVSKSDCPSYEEVVAAALRAIREGEEYVHFRDQDAHGEIPREFWHHLGNVTGRRFTGALPEYFSCSC